jgi:hypothetical protein
VKVDVKLQPDVDFFSILTFRRFLRPNSAKKRDPGGSLQRQCSHRKFNAANLIRLKHKICIFPNAAAADPVSSLISAEIFYSKDFARIFFLFV